MNSGRNLKRSWIAVDNEISSVSHYMMYIHRYNSVSSMLPHILYTFGLDGWMMMMHTAMKWKWREEKKWEFIEVIRLGGDAAAPTKYIKYEKGICARTFFCTFRFHLWFLELKFMSSKFDWMNLSGYLIHLKFIQYSNSYYFLFPKN